MARRPPKNPPPAQIDPNLAQSTDPNDPSVFSVDDDSDPLHNITGIEEDDDGGATITLEDSEEEENPDFFENLAEAVPLPVLREIAADYLELIETDKKAREARDKQYEDGLRRTGLGNDAPGGAEFEGASRVVHPIMAECCVDFTSSSIKELCPPDGPVRTKITGKETQEKIQKSQRKREHMNWQMTNPRAEYRAELEQLLTQLPLGGSQYLKIWWDMRGKRPRFEFTPIDNVYIPFAASSLYSATRFTIVNDLTEFEFRKRVREGRYKDVDLLPPDAEPQDSKSQKANDKIEGRKKTGQNEDGLRRTFEVYTYLTLEDDVYAPEDEAPVPYIMTIDEETSDVLAIYRNWDMDDAEYARLDWLVEFPFIPWRGAYAIGLPHLIGGLSAALTGALRALLDSAHIQNIPTLLKLKGARVSGQSQSIDATQVTEIEAAPGVMDIRQIAMPLPFNGPSGVLMQLLGWLDQTAKGVVGTAEEKLADATNEGPVGTTMALIEQGSKVMSAIHARLHASQRKVLEILHRLNKQYLDDEQTIEEIGELIVFRKDYEGPIDVEPVSDPHIFSETQRAAQNQLLLQLASMAPQIYDVRAIHKRILQTNKIQNLKEVLPDPTSPDPADPVSENVLMCMGKPAAAYPWQDHESHMMVHLHFMESPVLGMNPIIGKQYLPAALEHIKQHIVFFYARKMGEIVSNAAGGIPLTQIASDDPNNQNMLSKAFTAAIPHLDQLASANPLTQALPPIIQKAMQFIQANQPPPPMDPSQAAMQAAQLDAQTKTQATQAKAATDKAKLDQQAQTAQQQFQLQQAKLEADQQLAQQQLAMEHEAHQVDLITNDEDNRTATNLTLMKLADAGPGGGNYKDGSSIGSGINPNPSQVR